MTKFRDRFTRDRDLLITERVGSVPELGEALAEQLFVGPERVTRRAPSNLDALADVLREYNIPRITFTYWTMTQQDAQRVEEVFDDLGIEILR